MLSGVRSRAAVIATVLVVLGGLCVWYGALSPAPALGDYPDNAVVAEDTESVVGEDVAVVGRVVDTDPLTISVGSDGERRELRLTGTSVTADRGDTVRAFGTLTDTSTLAVEGAFAVPPRGHYYAWGISFLAGLWVLGRLLRHSRLDRGTLALAIRGDEDA
jgi:hypothetical protein